MVDKKYLVLGSFVILLVACTFFAFADLGSTINLPAGNSNYSTSFNISISVVANDITNMTCFYNASKGAPLTFLGTTINSSANQTVFEINDTSISSLTDGYFNVSCDFVSAASTGVNYTNMTSFLATFDSTPPAVVDNATNPVIQDDRNNSGGTGTNYNFNITITDATVGLVGGGVRLNVTNSSGDQNGSYYATIEGTASSYAVNINISHYPDGVYNITVYANDTVNNMNNSVIIKDWKVDSGVPIAMPENFTGIAVSNSNHSGNNILLNFSGSDAITDVNMIIFNITNSSGDVANGTHVGVREGNTNTFSVLFNTSWYPDGTYNITVDVNDTVGHMNNTAKIHTVKLDNTAPSISLSRTNYTSNSLGITISVSDTTSGAGPRCTVDKSYATVLGNMASQTLYSSQLSCGTSYSFTVTCSDSAGNSGSTTSSFSTSNCGGTTGGGGNSGSTSDTPSVKETFTFSEIAPGNPVTATNFDEAIGVTEVAVAVKERVENVKINVNKYDSRPSAVDPHPGQVYRYFEVVVTQVGENLESGKISMKVEKDWVDDAGIDSTDVSLFRYEGEGWRELETTFESEKTDRDYYYYSAEVPGFSYFAIGQQTSTIPEPPLGGEEPEPPAEEGSLWWIWLILAIVVIVIGFALGIGIKKKGK